MAARAKVGGRSRAEAIDAAQPLIRLEPVSQYIYPGQVGSTLVVTPLKQTTKVCTLVILNQLQCVGRSGQDDETMMMMKMMQSSSGPSVVFEVVVIFLALF